MGSALNQQQYLQALQQNPQLASQITQRLQAGNVQVPGLAPLMTLHAITFNALATICCATYVHLSAPPPVTPVHYTVNKQPQGKS